MATLALAAAAALAAGASAYGASESSARQGDANKLSAQSYAINRKNTQSQALQDAINNWTNQRQQSLDNRHYDESVVRENAQRALVNKMATAAQVDAQGNRMAYDPITGTWTTTPTGISTVNQDRARTLNANQYDEALRASTIGNMQDHTRQNQGAQYQNNERALAQELLQRFHGSQGRSREQIEGANIESNVADATDPLRTGGNMAMLAGYRQGNSGNDALLGSLARQSQGGTRAAIARARTDAPGLELNERDSAAKSILGPASTLAGRGAASPGDPVPVFGGDTSGNLVASLQRNNPAGVGTTLNPRSSSLQTGRVGALSAYQPLNASGNMAAGLGTSLQGLFENKGVQGLLASMSRSKKPLDGSNSDTTFDDVNWGAPTDG